MQEFSQIRAISLTLSKLNPPLGGDVEKVSIVLHNAGNTIYSRLFTNFASLKFVGSFE